MINWPVFFGVFFANYAFIFLKAFQQLNVTKDHFFWVIPTSMLMAIGEVFVVYNVAAQGFTLTTVLSCGLGGGTGAISSMFVHKLIVGDNRWQTLKKHWETLKHRCFAYLTPH
jgi:hypothetical protein